ncbi:MAG: DUF4390 domain-containing protein [Chromatiales bacterium]|nr:DUF4390 domain-containing protein [Chromatiales bacterium]
MPNPVEFLKRLKRGSGPWTLLFMLLAWTSIALAAEFEVRSAELYQRDGDWYLDADIDYRFSPTALEALDSGVPLTVEVEIEVLRPRRWIWDETLLTRDFRFQIRYHALAQLFQVVNMDNGYQRNFGSRLAAIRALGNLRNFRVTNVNRLKYPGNYEARLRASLDIEALPLPLRPVAYASPSWHMASDWYEWLPES